MNTATMSAKKKQKFNYQYVEYGDSGKPTGERLILCPKHAPKTENFKLVLIGTTDLECRECLAAKDSNFI